MTSIRLAMPGTLVFLVTLAIPHGRLQGEDAPPILEPAPVEISGAPDPRRAGDVRAILGNALTAPDDPQAKRLAVVLCASQRDRGHDRPGIHDYPLWQSRWTRLLNHASRVDAEPAEDWPSDDQWRKADIVVFNSYNPAWSGERDPSRIAALGGQLDAFLERGGGLVFIHFALNSGPNAPQLAERLGLAWGKGGRVRGGAKDWVVDASHPLAAGFDVWENPDESYWNMVGDYAKSNSRTLATSLEDNQPRPQMWTREVGAGRVFVCVPGHFSWTYDDPLYRALVFRGMMWTAKQPMDRLAPLVLIGARVTP